MFNRAAVLLGMKIAVTMLMMLGTQLEAAPTERGFMKPPDPLPSISHPSTAPQKSLNPSQYLKNWLQSTKAARPTDKAATRTITRSIRQMKIHPDAAAPDKQAKMLKMISALEELHRVFNSTLSSRITIMPRANGRNSGRKNKVLPAAEVGVKPTTATPAAVDSTASRASTDAVVPSLTGRNFRKSLPPQTKKTNKRVCFWKYCSQN
ncbi:urotensin II-related peptide [Amphiprion ocellaris]|uniref:Urotensin II-related peptide n=1 Tax=Amphiprion ocellaris TaxID=80972 RepID=A0AAQ5XQG2_AMPOC|nr:urotensin II-related peptide [Amphiprion ocellaris]